MRKAYTKPELTRVELTPSEAVLTSCRDVALPFIGPGGTGSACAYFWGLDCKAGGS
jgi:hypothetical protein